MNYQLKLSARRKTMAIRVADHKVTVYAPARIPEQVIEQWVRSKQGWIEKQLVRQGMENARVQNPLSSGEIQLFGASIRVETTQGSRTCYVEDDDTLCLVLGTRLSQPDKAAKALIKDYLAKKLSEYLETRLAHWQSGMNLKVRSVKIRHYKRRWGSCSSRGELSFNLLLAGAPHWVIDYVIVHELAHRVHLNHSASFWQLVENYYPACRDAELWLKLNGKALEISD